MPTRSPDSLDFTALAERLDRAPAFAEWGRAFPSRVDSTNRLALDLARERVRAGLSPHSLVVADEQTAGTGRRGRHWQSAAGAGLWCSLVMPPPGSVPGSPPAVVLAGALAEACERAGVPVGVKWPNDLFLDGGKAGGLLIDALTLDGIPLWRAGIGINWRPPAQALPDEYRGAGVAAWLDTGPDGVALAATLVETAAQLLQRPESWDEIMARLRRHHWLHGRTVRVESGDGESCCARAGALRSDGRLELILPGGETRRAGPNDRVRPVPDGDGADEETTREFLPQ